MYNVYCFSCHYVVVELGPQQWGRLVSDLSILSDLISTLLPGNLNNQGREGQGRCNTWTGGKAKSLGLTFSLLSSEGFWDSWLFPNFLTFPQWLQWFQLSEHVPTTAIKRATPRNPHYWGKNTGAHRNACRANSFQAVHLSRTSSDPWILLC